MEGKADDMSQCHYDCLKKDEGEKLLVRLNAENLKTEAEI